MYHAEIAKSEVAYALSSRVATVHLETQVDYAIKRRPGLSRLISDLRLLDRCPGCI
jgi:hypothetical protein